MVFRERVLQVTLVILTLPGALLAGQSQKATESPSSLQHVKSLPWESTGAKKSQTSIGQKDVPAGCPLSEKIAADEGLSHKGGSVFQTLSPQKLFSCLSWSVMVVESLDAKGSVIALGSGVVIGADHVITNRHAIEEGVSFRVEHGGKEWPADLVRVDPDHDLAELSIPELPANAAPVVTRDSSTLAVGEKVYAIGAPEGLELTISEGLISGLRDFGKGKVIQTSAAISQGSSGGGLFDAQGRLIGITTFYLKEGQSLNFALPAEWTVALDRLPIKATPSVSENSSWFQAFLWFEVGYSDTQSGKHDKAISAYREAIRLDPGFAGAWLNLGNSYDAIGQPEKAITALRESLRLKPGLVEAWYDLGLTYVHFGHYENAVNAYQKVIQLKPDFPGVWVSLGLAYLDLNQYDLAINAYREALRAKPDDEHAWTNLGVAYEALGKYASAFSAGQEALRLNPDSAVAWSGLGTVYFDLRQYNRAINAYQQALRLQPDLVPALYNMGLSYKAEGQRSEVIECYQKLKALNPELAEKLFQTAVLP
jgi:tetratricopeptide (TPR) repeat protein